MHFLRPSYDSFFPMNPILRISGPWVGYPHTWLMNLWTSEPIFCQGLGKWIYKIIIRFTIIHNYDAAIQIRSHGTVLSSFYV